MGTQTLVSTHRSLPIFRLLWAAILGFGGWTAQANEPGLPNIVLILVDDMGYSDLGCYGGEVRTPNLDRLASEGLRFTQAYNTSKCFPSRACLITGLYAQQCGYGETFKEPLRNAMTLGEVLQQTGYKTYWSGKHHGVDNPDERGFDDYYGLRDGAANHFNPGNRRPGEPEPAKKPGRPPRIWRMDGKTYAPYTPEDPSFYSTDAYTDKALKWLEKHPSDQQPFFLYMAYTAPHDPLMAWPEDIARYKGRYDKGYAAIYEERLQRQRQIGLFDASTPIPHPTFADWESLSPEARADEALRMEVYAAMTDRVDQNVGRLLGQLQNMGVLQNTLILFASDNGASAEVTSVNPSGTIGTIDRWASLGKEWANVSNTPLRYFKNDSYEGGIRTPLIAYWPKGIKDAAWVRSPVHFIDIMATFVDLTGFEYPSTWNNQPLVPLPGRSLRPFFQSPEASIDRLLFWEWARGHAVRLGDWKWVVRHGSESLYNLRQDPFETQSLLVEYSDIGAGMRDLFSAWKKRISNTLPE